MDELQRLRDVARDAADAATKLQGEVLRLLAALQSATSDKEAAEAIAAKQVMRSAANEAMADHYRAALEAIAFHDYGRLHPAFDPQREALKALKKAGVLGPNVRANRETPHDDA